MKIAVLAEEDQWKEIKDTSATVEWLAVTSSKDMPLDVAALFILKENVVIDYAAFSKPIFINSVAVTLSALKTPENVWRINGWSGFLSRQNWEIAGNPIKTIEHIFTAINKQYTQVPDEPGFIAARIIAMIINEAWFAVGEGISSKQAIDIAMKLGTNYPYGPFEWGERIGERKIYDLLQALSITNKRYLPAPLLQQKITT